jgi:hypothetical protein
MSNRTHPVTGHAYTVPVVRELPPRPVASAGTRVW